MRLGWACRRPWGRIPRSRARPCRFAPPRAQGPPATRSRPRRRRRPRWRCDSAAPRSATSPPTPPSPHEGRGALTACALLRFAPPPLDASHRACGAAPPREGGKEAKGRPPWELTRARAPPGLHERRSGGDRRPRAPGRRGEHPWGARGQRGGDHRAASARGGRARRLRGGYPSVGRAQAGGARRGACPTGVAAGRHRPTAACVAEGVGCEAPWWPPAAGAGGQRRCPWQPPARMGRCCSYLHARWMRRGWGMPHRAELAARRRRTGMSLRLADLTHRAQVSGLVRLSAA